MDDRILVTRSSLPPFEDFVEMIKPIWETGWLTNMGTYHQQLEAALKEHMGVDKLSLFCNGHMALELLLQAMNLTGEVITTPFTFASTTHAIVRNGLEPVFCDIKLDDYTIDETKIEQLITDRTTAIMPVHVYGNVCHVEAIEDIARKYNLKVIYDAAHAFDVMYKGENVSKYGDASMLSFHATKVFNTIEGGAVVYHEEHLGEELYKLKNFGIRSQEVVDGIGSNAKMNEIQAAMGLCNLKYIRSEIEKRKVVFEHYIERLRGIDGIHLPRVQEGVEKNYAYLPVLFDEKVLGKTRNQICDALARHDIYARKYFYPLTNTFECYKGRFDVDQTPKARYASNRILTLPLYAQLEISAVDKICDIIKEEIEGASLK